MPLTNQMTAQAVKFAEQCYNIGVFAERKRISDYLALQLLHSRDVATRNELNHLIQYLENCNERWTAGELNQ